MLAEEQLLMLPDDPEEAFVEYYKKIRENCTEYDHEFGQIFDKNAFIIHLLAFSQEYGLDLNLDEHDTDYYINDNTAFETLEKKLTLLASRISLRVSRKKRENLNPSYVLTESLRRKIHHHLNIIREDLQKLDLTDSKKDQLFNKLNIFAIEVDRDRTRPEAIAQFFVGVRKSAGAGVDKVQGILDRTVDILGMLSDAEEYTPILIEKEKRKLLEGPQSSKNSKKETASEDEMPF